MPPLQQTSVAQYSPAIGHRASRRGSATVPYEVLHSSELGPIEPVPEEPSGVCIYARNSFLTLGEETALHMQSNQDKMTGSPTPSFSSSNRRAGRRREARNSTLTRESKLSPCAWIECVDNPCIVS